MPGLTLNHSCLLVTNSWDSVLKIESQCTSGMILGDNQVEQVEQEARKREKAPVLQKAPAPDYKQEELQARRAPAPDYKQEGEQEAVLVTRYLCAECHSLR